MVKETIQWRPVIIGTAIAVILYFVSYFIAGVNLMFPLLMLGGLLVGYMATRGGAAALGLEDEIGTIEVGKKADLILVDMKSSSLTPLRNPISHLVYSANGADVDTVICNGEMLMKNRELLTINEAEVISRAEEASEDLLSKL